MKDGLINSDLPTEEDQVRRGTLVAELGKVTK